VTFSAAVLAVMSGHLVHATMFRDEGELARFMWWIATAPMCRRHWGRA